MNFQLLKQKLMDNLHSFALSEDEAKQLINLINLQTTKEPEFNGYWSRRPGKFVDKKTGEDLTKYNNSGLSFSGNVSDWYETLIEAMLDMNSYKIKTIDCSEKIADILKVTYCYNKKEGFDYINGMRLIVNHSLQDNVVITTDLNNKIKKLKVLDLNG